MRSGGEGGPGLARHFSAGDQLRGGAFGQSLAVLALKLLPVLEGGAPHSDAGEEVPGVEVRRACKAGAVARCLRQEGPDLGLEQNRVQPDGLACHLKPGNAGLAEPGPEIGERMLEAVARLWLGPVAPEEGGEGFVRAAPVRRRGADVQERDVAEGTLQGRPSVPVRENSVSKARRGSSGIVEFPFPARAIPARGPGPSYLLPGACGGVARDH